MLTREINLRQGRMLIVLAALLWSTSGMLGKMIALPGPTMACFRALFAGLVLVLLLRPRHFSFRFPMLGMIACFAIMNVCYVTAITKTTAANAIFLQYTAPGWMFLASVFLLREPVDRRSLIGLIIGFVGIAVIIGGGWQKASIGVALGLIAGAAYGGVAVFLRVLRHENPIWLTFLNHAASGVLLLPMVLGSSTRDQLGDITAMQWFGMAIYGGAQMAIPYIMFSRAMSVVTPQEAGLISLLEPVVNPMFTWLAVRELPESSTVLGGAIILIGVGWRYLRSSGVGRS